MISLLIDAGILIAFYLTVVEIQKRINGVLELIWIQKDILKEHKHILNRLMDEIEALKKGKADKT